MIVRSTASRLMTGSTPGMPRQTGSTCGVGGDSRVGLEHPQNILLCVSS